ncbi:DNA cytosine methyltransferase (plasmid) [Paenibacillus urinalis]|uniref:DNA cytosine methyltransferase n=1 Tax=Paenibacillus TaxID=44249 RepID=UPI00204155B3|nr:MULTISPECIES: DNA cytosine methyltransferase [Paenibacillus]MCM3130546.1 DNA cytosine methyltransferase [Paenibacillus sp. MER 78]WDH95130.1 DNA cytosine methyltransferase [Paenibacillus urinalis]
MVFAIKPEVKTEHTVAHLFGGAGGGSLGFAQARAEYMGYVGRFRTLCSIDADPVVCQNYELITGGKAVCMDLFSREQYIDFHGDEPPNHWHEATPGDLWDAFGWEVPDVIFTSPPCKGFSGLLPEKSAKTKKYQALNMLTIRGLEIALKACLEYGGHLPALILLENVPRIMTRGKQILDRIKKLLQSFGYITSDNTHDCGELGGLAERRKRYLLISRQEKRVKNFVYQPPRRPLKTIGDVIKDLPFPGDTVAAGPLHRLPKLEWKTWMRLALIPAGGDWRDLNKLDWWNYRVQHEPRRGAWAVEDWNSVSRTITGGAGPGRSNGASAVSDPRMGLNEGSTHRSIYRMSQWDEASQTVTGAVGPNNGAICVNDPRLKERKGRHPGVYQVVRHDEPSPCVTGTRFGSGALAFSDPRNAAPSNVLNGTEDGTFPADQDRGVYLIIAEDGTWHRPLTTYELAMLQSFPAHLPNGMPFQLVGCSDAKAREYIGNAVPPEAAKAMGTTFLVALMAASVDAGFTLSYEAVWVRNESEQQSEAILH